ncbi:MAG: tetratricopeptide repeat protein [Elusimicrobia bacterium]|nr:tetratricopeptide repeat protein [Elusimicrobiota bacterium]
MRLAFLLLGLLRPAWGADEFLKNLRRAERLSGLEEKIEYCTRAIRAWTPSDGNSLLAHCHFRRGQARYENAKFPEAESDLAKSLSLDPGNAQAHLLLGKIEMRLGRWESASRAFKEYTVLNPKDGAGWLRLADSYRGAGKHRAAAKAYAKAAQATPEDFRTDLGLARAALARKDWPAAQGAIELARSKSRGRAPEVFSAKADLEAARGNERQALSDQRRAIELGLRELEDLTRGRASPVDILESREKLSQAYRQACRWGDRQSCAQGQESHAE